MSKVTKMIKDNNRIPIIKYLYMSLDKRNGSVAKSICHSMRQA